MNVLFIISDQHRRDASGCYGHTLVQTPNIDRLASEGMRFDRAYCPAPLCGPSRAALLTGTHVHTSGIFTHKQEEGINELVTMGDAFRAAGYRTGALGKMHIIGESPERDLGFDERALRIYNPKWSQYIDAAGREAVFEYAHYSDPDRKGRHVYNIENQPVDLEEEKMYDHMVVDLCIEFMKKHSGKPFLLWAGLEKPHPELYAPAAYHEMYADADIKLPSTVRFEMDTKSLPRTLTGWGTKTDNLNDDELRNIIRSYYANTTYLDHSIGRLLDALDELGIADTTIVVYTTDHGDNLLEHGLFQKHCFYEGAVGVPLIVRAQGTVPAGTVSRTLVSLIDLFPTLGEMTCVPVPESVEGRSVYPALIEEPMQEIPVYSEFYSWGAPERMMIKGDFKYIHTIDENAQLYNLSTDPEEVYNLAKDPSYSDTVSEMKKQVLEGWELPPEGYKCRPQF
jgi:choline-sulfatase